MTVVGASTETRRSPISTAMLATRRMVSSRICSSPRGDSQLGAAAFTPIQELKKSWNSIYTVPQNTENKMAMSGVDWQLTPIRPP